MRTCARPACPRPASATLSYAYAERVVWVAELTPESHPMVHDLCEQHAGTVSVPRGWELRDERQHAIPAPRIGSPGQPAEFGEDPNFAARASVA